jgi:hypothetical protein
LVTEDDDKLVAAIVKLVGRDIPTERADKIEKQEKTEKADKPEKPKMETIKKFPKAEKSPRRYAEEKDDEGNSFDDSNMPAFLRK